MSILKVCEKGARLQANWTPRRPRWSISTPN